MKTPNTTVTHLCLRLLAGLVLVALMLVTLLDVLGRYLLNNPLHGGHVVVQILVGVLVFLGIPLLVHDNEFIKVELMDSQLPPAIRCHRDRLVAVVVFLFLALLSGQFAWQSLYFIENGEYFESIRIPVSWVAMFACGMSTIAAVFGLRRCFATMQTTADQK